MQPQLLQGLSRLLLKETVSASSCNTHVIQGKDVPASLMEETNLFTQNLYESAPADFWESVMDDIEAIKATASVVLVKYATNKANSANKSRGRP